MRISTSLALMALLGSTACSEAPDTRSAAPATSAAPISAAPLVPTERLPKAFRAPLDEAPAQRLDVIIAADGVRIDEGPLWASTPEAGRAAAWPAGRPSANRVAAYTDYTLDPAGEARLHATLKGAAKRGRGAADVRVIADAEAPYALVARVFGAARQAGFKRWWIRARGRTQPGDFRTRRARWCTESAESPVPCSITWALIDDRFTHLQVRASTEAACGIPPDGTPKPSTPLITGPRGKCLRLKHAGTQVAAAIIPPHRQKTIKGKRCAYATVAAWPTATWTQVVEVADGLRAAGHTTIALSLAAADATCPAPDAAPDGAPTSAPASAAPASR